jgi:hypothetical protein
LARDGTAQARTGFAVVLTEVLGAQLASTGIPEAMEAREAQSLFRRWHGEGPKYPDDVPPIPKPQPKPKRERTLIDWAALNPGRKFREERQTPSPEREGVPESAGPGKARKP